MSDEAKTTPTWGYHKTKEPQIFDLKEGESLPKGWADTPAAYDSEAKADSKPEPKGDEPKVEAKPDLLSAGTELKPNAL